MLKNKSVLLKESLLTLDESPENWMKGRSGFRPTTFLEKDSSSRRRNLENWSERKKGRSLRSRNTNRSPGTNGVGTDIAAKLRTGSKDPN